MPASSSFEFTVLRGADPLPSAFAHPVLAIGNFDGVHRGHRAVFATARAMADSTGVAALALTFEPHPRTFFDSRTAPFRLTPEADKLKQIDLSGLSGAIVLPFDATLANMEAEAFVRDILVGRYAISGVAVGFDFHFGRARIGSPAFLQDAGRRHGFAVTVVDAARDEGDTISSTAIRRALAAGQVGHASHMLGRPFSIVGEVRHGEKRGRTIGFPTANLALPADVELAFGIYAVRVITPAGRFDGVASYGRRPTFDNGAPLLEVYIFDFAGDLYGQKIEVEFHAYLRPERKFPGLEALMVQISEDVRRARLALDEARAASEARSAHP